MEFDLTKFNIKSGLNTKDLLCEETNTRGGNKISKNYAAEMNIFGKQIGGLYDSNEASIFNNIIKECAGDDNILDENEAQTAINK